MPLDQIGKRIVALLLKNARMSATAIGREVGLSRPAVQDRIAAMEQSAIIQGYHAQISENAGLQQAVLFITITERPCAPTLRWLADLSGVNSVISLAGDIDALVMVAVPDTAALSQLTDKILASSRISTLKTSVVLSRF